MTETQSKFAVLMERVRAGCPQAAQEVFDLYSDAVRHIVRRHLGPRLRTQADSQDFLQLVWTSFFQDFATDRYTFPDPDSLINFLTRLARNKMTDVYRSKVATGKRNPDRTHSLDTPPEGEACEVAIRQPTPSQLVIAEEQWERMLCGLPPKSRRILEMLRQGGYSHKEIAEEVGCSTRLIHRLIENLRERWGLP